MDLDGKIDMEAFGFASQESGGTDDFFEGMPETEHHNEKKKITCPECGAVFEA